MSKPTLPPSIPGTTADDEVYLLREGHIPRLKARYPLYILGAGAVMALLSMGVAGWLTFGAENLEGDDRQNRYVHALAVAAIGGGASATLLGIGSTALQIGGEQQSSIPAHYYPASSSFPMGESDLWAMQPATEPPTEPEPVDPRPEYRGLLENVELPGEQDDYEARLAQVSIDRIQAEVLNTLDGLKCPNM